MDAAVRLEREKRKTLQEQQNQWRERLVLDRVLSPNLVRLAMITGIIAYGTYCARSKKNVGPVQSAVAYTLAGVGIPLIAADAGIKDKYALGAISAVSLGYMAGQTAIGWGEAGLLPSPSNLIAQIGAIPGTLISEINPWD